MIRLFLLCITALLLPGHAFAFSSAACDTGAPSLADVTRALTAADRLEAALNSQPHHAALIARRGGDITGLAPDLLFTHAALAWRKGPDAPWQVVHMLNDCGGSGSTLYAEGLGAFFLQAPYSYQSLMMPLPEQAAMNLQRWLSSGKPLDGVHEPRYSLTAHPFSGMLQNSNGFVLEALAVFMEEDSTPSPLPSLTLSRKRAQAVLQKTGFKGTRLAADLATRVLGPLFKANLDLSDQPRPAQPEVVTVKSITDWLQRLPDAGTAHLKPVLVEGPLR